MKDRRVLVGVLPLGAAYTAGVVATATAAARRLGWSRLPRLIVVVPILHASYGSGFLLGLARFLPRWWTPEPAPPALPPRSAGPHHGESESRASQS